MTIDEAIKRLEYSYHHNTILFNNLDKDALKLGIEDLKARKRDRELDYVDLDDLLPGETKD